MNSGTELAGTDRIHLHDVGYADDAGDRRDVADEIVAELVVERHVDRRPRVDQEQRVAVGARACDRLGGDVAAGAQPVLDDEWLAEPVRQPLPYQARGDVGGAAGSEADDDAHRPRWIGLRQRGPGGGRQCGGARCQPQECSARKLHGAPSVRLTLPRCWPRERAALCAEPSSPSGLRLWASGESIDQKEVAVNATPSLPAAGTHYAQQAR